MVQSNERSHTAGLSDLTVAGHQNLILMHSDSARVKNVTGRTEINYSIQSGPFISLFVLKPKWLRNLSGWNIWQAKRKSVQSQYNCIQTTITDWRWYLNSNTALNLFFLIRILWRAKWTSKGDFNTKRFNIQRDE